MLTSRYLTYISVVCLTVQLAGCGTVRQQRATEQLLLSDAVDRSVAELNFAPLAYQKVFLETRYLQFKNDSPVTTNYVISSLRQQMVVAGCLLQDSIDDADYVVEARVGALGTDAHEINYGVPPSNTVNAAASLLTSAPLMPTLPEISLGRRTEEMAAAKIAVFAYDRETRMPVWQSGTSLARSEAAGTWILGAGPIQRGSIYKQPRFPGDRLKGLVSNQELSNRDYVYRGEATWDRELQERVESGAHLEPPRFDESEAEEAQTEVAQKEEDTQKG